MTTTQPSKLMASVIPEPLEESRITVLHIGNAQPETVDFFSNYRCRLHFVDLFAELPIHDRDDNLPSLAEQFDGLFSFPKSTQFDVCLFWDIFNYLDDDAMFALQVALRPYLGAKTRAHAFAVHNLRSPRNEKCYSVRSVDVLGEKPWEQPLPGYAPHNQAQLKELLTDFELIRNVLLSDGRLEMALGARVHAAARDTDKTRQRVIL
ncbi:MAG: hypothetical protein ABJ084_08040 [Halioglobus sp.]